MPPRKDSQTLDHLLHQMDLAFTNVTGQTISFIDQSGSWHGPLRLERFTQFCRCVMDSPEGAARCRACNHTMGLRAGDGVVVECCHMGVSVISMPVPVEEERSIYLSYGQFLTQDTQAEFYRRLEDSCAQLGLDYGRLQKAAAELRVLSREELDARVQLLRIFASYLAVSQSELRTRMEYAQQMEKKLELERKLHSMEFKFLQSQISPHFLFNTLNLLMRTAYRENAAQTAGLICDLSDLLRRAYRAKDSVCTLSEELLRITVSDNGDGIPQPVLEQLEEGGGEGSGLRNVSDRLKLFFGPEARMDIASRPGQGATVELLCPLDREGGVGHV